MGILVAVVLTFVVLRVIKRVLMRVLDLPGSDRGRAEARQGAVASALRGALVGVIWSVATIFIIGEVGINIGAFVATATVERITLRSVRLRDGFGTAWYVPHGGVASVGNLSKPNVTRLAWRVSPRLAMSGWCSTSPSHHAPAHRTK